MMTGTFPDFRSNDDAREIMPPATQAWRDVVVKWSGEGWLSSTSILRQKVPESPSVKSIPNSQGPSDRNTPNEW